MDLRDRYLPGGGPSRLTFRLLQNLIDHLPPESATKTAVRDSLSEHQLAELGQRSGSKGHGPWAHRDMLLARISDQLDWVIYAQYASQGGKPEKPKPLPRPGVRSNVRALRSQDFDRLHRLRNRQEA